MHRFWRVCLALGCAGMILPWVPGRADAKDEASFLDQPVPSSVLAMAKPVSTPDPNTPTVEVETPMVGVTSLAKAVELLGKISGKKTVLDPGLGTWPGEATEEVSGVSFGFQKTDQARMAFERVSLYAGLAWNYDQASDTILLTPDWKRDDPRNEEELIRIIGQTRPVQWEKLPRSTEPNGVGGHGIALDEWRIAFDALVSKPANYSSAGTLRLYHDQHGHVDVMHFPVDNVFSGTFRDGQGKPFILLLNEQLSGTNKDDAGDLAYYLFDERGWFVKGGVYAVADGAESGITGVKLQDNRINIDVGYGSFKMNPDHLHLGLVNGDLILLGSTDHKGKERNAEETRQSLCQFSHIMQLKFSLKGTGN